MTCQELERLLYPYLDGEFQPEERVDLETHLTGCAACQRRVEEEKQMQQALRRAARHSVQQMRAPASLRAGIELGMKQQQRRAQYGVWLRAGAMALVVVTVGGGWATYQSEQRLRLALHEAVQRHSKVRPFDIASTNPEDMELWFKGNVDPRVTVPQLPKAKALGGRISILNGKEVAYISYETLPQNEGEPSRRLGVFVLPDDGQTALAAAKVQTLKAVEVDAAQGYNVVTWRDDEIVYEMVTDMDEDDIRRMLAERDNGEALARKSEPQHSEEPLFSPMPAQHSRPSIPIETVTFPR